MNNRLLAHMHVYSRRAHYTHYNHIHNTTTINNQKVGVVEMVGMVEKMKGCCHTKCGKKDEKRDCRNSSKKCEKGQKQAATVHKYYDCYKWSGKFKCNMYTHGLASIALAHACVL